MMHKASARMTVKIHVPPLWQLFCQTVSTQKALSLLPVSDKIGVSAGHSVPGGRGGTS